MLFVCSPAAAEAGSGPPTAAAEEEGKKLDERVGKFRDKVRLPTPLDIFPKKSVFFLKYLKFFLIIFFFTPFPVELSESLERVASSEAAAIVSFEPSQGIVIAYLVFLAACYTVLYRSSSRSSSTVGWSRKANTKNVFVYMYIWREES